MDAHKRFGAPLYPEDDQAADDEGRGDHRGVEQMGLDRLVNEETDDAGGHETDGDIEDKASGFVTAAELAQGAGNPLPVDDDHRQDRAGLDRNVENLRLVVGHAQQGAGQDQMPGRRNRQEFGQAFNDAHHGGLQQQYEVQIHSRGFKLGLMIACEYWAIGEVA